MDMALVHRILLSDPSDFGSLRRTTAESLTFEEFREGLLHSSNPLWVVKRAYHDHVQETVERTQNLDSLNTLLVKELHPSIRALVPNRPDLHSILKDDRDPPDTSNALEILPWIVEAAQALAQLESEARAATTRAWISLATNTTTTELGDPLSFLAHSLFYLIDKTEICAKEKEDFYLSQVVAPRLYNTGEGYTIERKELLNRYGDDPPITRDWIKSLVEGNQQNQGLQKSHNNYHSARRTTIQRGWIDTILFNRNLSTVLPEIFFLDAPTLQSIRNSTRMAASGCALGWHASRAAKCNPEILLQEESKGAPLVRAMQNRNHVSIQEYEQSVADAVVSLAKSYTGSSLDAHVEETLRGQTRAVLRGEDAVMKLLDERTRKQFVDLAVDTDFNAPLPTLRSGRQQSVDSKKEDSPYVSKARLGFCAVGLGFYASELARASELATKVPSLAYELYAEEFLDQMFSDALKAKEVGVD